MNNKQSLILLGDIHGDLNPIPHALKQAELCGAEFVLQIGDFGFRDTYRKLHRYSSDKLKILFGNHDDQGDINNHPHFLPRFGIMEVGSSKIFFVGGAWSIDKHYRREGVSWWQEEELGYQERIDCFDLWKHNYKDIDIVISHEAPIVFGYELLHQFPIENNTNGLLQDMYVLHNPPRWYCGHYHTTLEKHLGSTKFRCLNINEILEIEV